jgi:hypothetical protein
MFARRSRIETQLRPANLYPDLTVRQWSKAVDAFVSFFAFDGSLGLTLRRVE